jgi:hypothetical protein
MNPQTRVIPILRALAFAAGLLSVGGAQATYPGTNGPPGGRVPHARCRSMEVN